MRHLCACGCGELAPEGKVCRQRHQFRGQANPSWRGGQRFDKKGYVCVRKQGHHRADQMGYVRRSILVYEAATGVSVPRDHDIHHINGIVTDDRMENLLLLTHGAHRSLHQRMRHANGIKLHGEQVGSSKLTAAEVAEIRRLGTTDTQKHLGELFGVHPSHIGRILRGEYWPNEAAKEGA